MKCTTVFDKLLDAYCRKPRIIVNVGGTRSSKTISELQLGYHILTKKKDPFLISVVSESMPHLKRGAINDLKQYAIPDEFNYDNWHDTDKVYSVTKDARLEFFSADQPDKVHGPSRNGLILNEIQNMQWETVRQLMQRTSDWVWMDYNPTHDFWVEDKILTRPDVIKIHSTYLDNEFLPEGIRHEIEINRSDADWWQVYGLGLTGKREGMIYTNWEQVDSFPVDAQISYGLDFGFNHPAVLVRVGLYNDCIYIDEMFYKSGMITQDIINECKKINGVIYADSSRPESIEEIARAGIKILPCIKGQGSVNSQISFIKKYPIKVTKSSLNIIKELRNYRWLRDKNGNVLDEPVKVLDDGMDSFRYATVGKWFRNFTGAKFKF